MTTGVAEKILVALFLAGTMLSVGVRSGPAGLRVLLASRMFLVRVLAANFLAVPLVGFAIARFAPLSPACATALLLLACAPGGLSGLQFTSKVHGEVPGAMPVLLSLLAALVAPLVLPAILPPGGAFMVSHGRVLAVIALCAVVPLAAGIVLHGRAPALAPALSKALGAAGALAFVAFMFTTRSVRTEALAGVGGVAIAAMALLIAASMAIGWVLGGPARETRQLLATTTSMRNAALGLAVVTSTPAGEPMVAPLLAFSLLMAPPNLLLTLWGAIRVRRAGKRSARTGNPT